MKADIRAIAFYLPQYHPIPENDAFWGEGFTEWTNVRNAAPLFRNHHQPVIPGELGYYDLRNPETRSAQAELARTYGIAGFCYWHYWFGNGRRLLERPFTEVLRSGEPDFPFCLGWANESWTGVWHGAPGKILMEQTYPPQDVERHFHAVSEAFSDRRYLTVEGKPIFYVYKPGNIPEPRRFVEQWQNLAVRAGLPGIFFIGEDLNVDDDPWDPAGDGFDGVAPNAPGVAFIRLYRRKQFHPVDFIIRRGRKMLRHPDVHEYRDYIECALVEPPEGKGYDLFPCVLPNWDNTPRSGVNGRVLVNSTPELFREHLRGALRQVADKTPDRRIVFLKSWNEWAEGNYLEPDQRYGRAYLEVCRDELQ